MDELVLILGKGNNSKKNFEALQDKLRRVGSLVPTQHKNLLALSLEDYEGTWADCRFHRLTRNVMGIECTLVPTYSERLACGYTHYSLIQSAKRHGLDPFAYLRGVLIRIREIPDARLSGLFPDRRKAQAQAAA